MHADKVIGVHDSVDESIEENGEVNVSVIHDIGIEPIKEKDGEMMVDMKKGKLTPLFANNDEKGVPKVPNFGDIKEPE